MTILRINRMAFFGKCNRIMSSSIFEAVQLSLIGLNKQLQSCLLRSTLEINKNEVVLILTENYLVLCQNVGMPRASHYCRLGFELKFEVFYHKTNESERLGVPISIRLEKENCSEVIMITANSSSIIEAWSLELEKKINQRNFHKLFKAKRKIGKGAFATVYLVERLRDGKMMAVKAFSKEKQFSGQKGKESLENEIKVMRLLNHSNVMKLEGVYQTENSIYVILEYMEGKQLNDLLKQGKRLEDEEINSIIKNILQGLSHLAKRRVIHRDLKPENIIFRKEGSYDLALCDFGLATHADQEKYLFLRCGTPGFVAPEIINIQDLSTRCDPISDVFSAGIIFHNLLFGASIFEGKKYKEILNQNRACSFDFRKEMYTKIPRKALDLLTKMLERDPTKRLSAENALRAPYFVDQMECQEGEAKRAFMEVGNLQSPLSCGKSETLASQSRRNSGRMSFYERKENSIMRKMF